MLVESGVGDWPAMIKLVQVNNCSDELPFILAVRISFKHYSPKVHRTTTFITDSTLTKGITIITE